MDSGWRDSRFGRGHRTREVNGTVVVGIDLVDHVLQLRLGGVLAERAHDGAQLLGGDLSYSIHSSQLHARVMGTVLSYCRIIGRESIADGRTHHRHPCPITAKYPLMSGSGSSVQSQIKLLTNREKASLYSETCSSVRESAYTWCDVAISHGILNGCYLTAPQSGEFLSNPSSFNGREGSEILNNIAV